MPLLTQQRITRCHSWLIACSFLISLAMVSGADGNEPARRGNALFDGKTLEGWEVVGEQDFSQHGEVQVQEGVIRIAAGLPASGIRYSGEVMRTNYDLSFDARRDEGSDFFCGLTFPVGDDYLTLIVGGWGGSIVGLSNLDGASASENESTHVIDFDNGKWYRFRLQVEEKSIRLWIDEEETFDIDIEDRELSIWWEQEPMRPLGICSWYTSTSLRNIEMRSLDASGDDPPAVERGSTFRPQPRRRIFRRRRMG